MAITDSKPLLEQVFAASALNLSPDAAEAILKLRLPEAATDRIQDLADKNSAGVLTDDERREFEQFVMFSSVVGMLQKQARLVLKSRPTAA